MGHQERKRIIDTKDFVEQLKKLNIPFGCLQASILAMGASNINLYDVIYSYENKAGIQNLDAYLYEQGLSLGISLKIDHPLSLNQMKNVIETPKSIIADLDTFQNSNSRVVGILFAFGEYQDKPAHVVGILPRGDMTKNLRKILKREKSHMVVDTSHAGKPIYFMTVENITDNLNALILNGVDVSMHVVTKLKSKDHMAVN